MGTGNQEQDPRGLIVEFVSIPQNRGGLPYFYCNACDDRGFGRPAGRPYNNLIVNVPLQIIYSYFKAVTGTRVAARRAG